MFATKLYLVKDKRLVSYSATAWHKGVASNPITYLVEGNDTCSAFSISSDFSTQPCGLHHTNSVVSHFLMTFG
jgi:hypothetical protein